MIPNQKEGKFHEKDNEMVQLKKNNFETNGAS